MTTEWDGEHLISTWPESVNGPGGPQQWEAGTRAGHRGDPSRHLESASPVTCTLCNCGSMVMIDPPELPGMIQGFYQVA